MYKLFFEQADPDSTEKDKEGNEVRRVGLHQYGASREHRPNPIVQMGMFIDMTGFRTDTKIVTNQKIRQIISAIKKY